MSFQPGIYRLKNAASHRYMHARTQPPRSIDGSHSHPDNRAVKWAIEAREGLYTLQNVATNEYASTLVTADNSKVEGSPSPFNWCLMSSDGDRRTFYVPDTVGNKVFIKEDSGGNIIAAQEHDDTSHQIQWYFEWVEWTSFFNPNLPGASQHWASIRYPSRSISYQNLSDHDKQTYCGPLAPGIYCINSLSTGTIIDLLDGRPYEGTKVIGNTSDNTANQQWHLELGSTGYRIKNVAGKTFLGFRPHQAREGIQLTGDLQPVEWDIRTTPRGHQIHLAGKPGAVVDLSGGGSSNGTPILLWPNHGGGNQQWRFTKVDGLVAVERPIANNSRLVHGLHHYQLFPARRAHGVRSGNLALSPAMYYS